MRTNRLTSTRAGVNPGIKIVRGPLTRKLPSDAKLTLASRRRQARAFEYKGPVLAWHVT